MRVRGVATAATLARCIAHAKRRHPKPDVLVLTGDLVHDDPVRRFAVASAAVELAQQAQLDVLGHVLRIRVAAQARDAAADDDVVVFGQEVLDLAAVQVLGVFGV